MNLVRVFACPEGFFNRYSKILYRQNYLKRTIYRERTSPDVLIRLKSKNIEECHFGI